VEKKALRFSVYSCEDRTLEFRVVGKAHLEGYTAVLGDNSSDEVLYLVKPEDLHGTVLDHLDEQTLEASVTDYFEVEDAYEWAGLTAEERREVAHWTTKVENTDNRGKVEEV
jgi:hypothetical protein